MNLVTPRGESSQEEPTKPRWKQLAGDTLERAARVRPVRNLVRRLADKGLVPQPIWWWMRFDGPFTMSADGGKQFTYVASKDDRIGHLFFWAGVYAYEPETLRVFVKLARTARGFLDIGAASGAFTLVASSVNESIVTYAFEPLDDSYARLAEHIRINALSGRCFPIKKALSDQVGTAEFFVPDPSVLSRDCSFLVDVREEPEWPGRRLSVETTTAATVVPADEPIDLVKIDAEGAEAVILKGMHPLLVAQRPVLIIEFFWNGSYREACATLDSLGYRYYHLTPDGPIPVPAVNPSPGDLYMNYLCVPESRELSPDVFASA
jgi:FkbM family methyltransferase